MAMPVWIRRERCLRIRGEEGTRVPVARAPALPARRRTPQTASSPPCRPSRPTPAAAGKRVPNAVTPFCGMILLMRRMTRELRLSQINPNRLDLCADCVKRHDCDLVPDNCARYCDSTRVDFGRPTYPESNPAGW